MTRHGRFAGQITSFGHAPVREQSITHTPAMHVPDEHPCTQMSNASGETSGGGASGAASTGIAMPWSQPLMPGDTQKPSRHDWSLAQSLAPEHSTVQFRNCG
jgi:hypothetical protein